MLKKIICILLLFIMTGCGKNVETEKIEYIQPVNDILIMSMINESLSKRLFSINNKDLENYQFKMLYKDVYENDLYDIDNHIVRLTSFNRLVLQVVSVNCEHCHKLLEEMSLDEDIYKHVLYFDVGNNEEVRELVNELNADLLKKAIVIAKDDGLSEYIRKELDLSVYPTSLFYKNGTLSFSYAGNYSDEQYAELLDIAFINDIKSEEFINEEGVNVIDMARGIKDVEADLSKRNRDLLNSLPKNSVKESLTYLGKMVDFDNMQKVNSDIFLNEVDDFGIYKDKKLVIFFIDIEDEKDIESVNELIKEKDDYEYLAIINDSFYSESDKYLGLNEKLLCKAVSSLSSIPKDIMNVSVHDYPSCLYIDKGIITGLLVKNESKEIYKKATELFFESSIAVKY